MLCVVCCVLSRFFQTPTGYPQKWLEHLYLMSYDISDVLWLITYVLSYVLCHNYGLMALVCALSLGLRLTISWLVSMHCVLCRLSTCHLWRILIPFEQHDISDAFLFHLRDLQHLTADPAQDLQEFHVPHRNLTGNSGQNCQAPNYWTVASTIRLRLQPLDYSTTASTIRLRLQLSDCGFNCWTAAPTIRLRLQLLDYGFNYQTAAPTVGRFVDKP